MRAEHTLLFAHYNDVRLIFVCPSVTYQLIGVNANIVCSHPVCIQVMGKQNVASEHFEGEVNYVKKFASKVLAHCDS
jgi:hypothetical protein